MERKVMSLVGLRPMLHDKQIITSDEVPPVLATALLAA
jgi:hypothetical protein